MDNTKQKDEQGLVTVYKAATRNEAMIAKALLEGASIRHYITGDGFRSFDGYSIIGDVNVGFRPFLVQVLQEDEAAAREALKPLLEEPEPIDEETLARLAEEAGESESTQ